MSEKIRKVMKKIVPISLRRRIGGYRYGFFGPYSTWKETEEKGSGYDSEQIVQKVTNALLKVKRGEAAYERDSILFDTLEYRWPVLASLLLAASTHNNTLNIIDFGGSLGSTYFQHQNFLKELDKVSWNIVEQANFVSLGKQNFADTTLHFFNSIKECLEAGEKPSVVLFSSVIQYLEKPYEILDEVVKNEFEYLIFDRTPFLQNGQDMVTLQKVPPQVYPASYPCWFLGEEKFRTFFASTYELLAEFGSDEGKVNQHGVQGEFKGFLFKRKKLTGSI